MSKLDDMIRELCPDGVEYIALGKIAVRTKGTPITAAQMKSLDKSNAPVKIFAGGKTVAYFDYADLPEKDVNTYPSVVVKSRGVIEFEYYDKPFSHKNEMWSYHSERDDVDIKYLYYFLKTQESKLREKATSMGAFPQIAIPDTEQLIIPIPPLSVQSEIVRILDNFTELTAELTARKKQYEYYRNHLLTFGDDVQWQPLDSVANVIDSLHQTPSYVKDGLSMIRVTDIKGGYIDLDVAYKVEKETFEAFIKKYAPQKDDLVMSRVGSYGNVSIVPSSNTVCMGQNTVVIHPLINNKFLYYILTAESAQNFIEKNVGGGSQKTLSLKSIKEIPIPIIEETEQIRIVAILDRFDSLTIDITSGLPAEIAARQKQYEYYRDRLLTFKEIA